jgi:hypothetical protein
MLRNLKDLENYAIRATDGDIGHVKDFYFDDEAWAVRYLIVETGGWLSSRKVLISPIAVGKTDWTIQGYIDNSLEIPVCEIAIFNFGKSIAETLKALPSTAYI